MDSGDRERKFGRGADRRRGPAYLVTSSVSVVAFASALVACSEQPTSDTTDGEAPSTFTERVAFASCGEILLDQGETVPGSAWVCLDAATDTGAELVVEMPTTEGDLVVTYYRVGPSIDGLEVFRDATRDSFGPGTWSHELCPETTAVSEPLGCGEV